jgi:serine/threonine protein kinase
VLQRRGMKSSDLEFNMNEVGILSVVGSDHVPYLLDVFENFNQIFIVQEFIEGISLN